MTPSLSAPRAAALGFCALLVGIGLGRFGYPALIPALVGAGWATPKVAHVAGASNLAGYMIGALAAGWTVRLAGARATVVVALWLTVASFAFSAVPLPALPFAALRLLSGITGGVLMAAVAPAVAAAVDPRRRGIVGGIAFSGIGIGIVASGSAVPLMAGQGLAAAWLAIAAVLAVASAVASWAMPADPPRAGAAARATASGWSRPGLAITGLAIAYTASAIGYVPHTVVFVDYVARVLGHGLGAGGLIWIATGLGAVVSPLAAGVLADRMGFAVALRLVLAAMAFGTAVPVAPGALAPLAVSGMLAGGFMIALASLAAGRAREIVGPERHASVWGRLTALFAVAQAAAAYATSGILAIAGDYVLVFGIAASMTAAGLATEMATAARGRERAGGDDRG